MIQRLVWVAEPVVPSGSRRDVKVAVHGRDAVRIVLLIVLASLGLLAKGQSFNANTYYQQCLRFEAGGDLETARQSCLNALQLDPRLREAELALARINVALGNLSQAEPRLLALRQELMTAEPAVLLADIALRQGRLAEAERFLREAASRLQQQYSLALDGRRHYLAGRLAERRGDVNAALAHYQAAIDADVLSLDYRLADAELRLRLGDAQGARRELEAYVLLTGDSSNPTLLSLLGRIHWAQGDMHGAIGYLEAAASGRTLRERSELERDLRDLALVYYGQGDLRSGNLALRTALRRGNLLANVLSSSLLWLLVLLAVVALQLIGESRVEPTSTVEVVEGPEPWSVGSVYRTLLAGLLGATVISLGYGYWAYNNFLAVVTPLQSVEVRAIFLIALALLVSLLSVWQVQRNRWDAMEVLVGRPHGIPLGILIGLGLLAITFVYLLYEPQLPYAGTFYLNVAQLTPTLIAAVVVLPLSELFFRAFALPPMARRYGPGLAVAISTGLYALVLASPLVLLIIAGAALGEGFRRTGSGLTPLIAQWVYYLGLVLLTAFSGWARALFL